MLPGWVVSFVILLPNLLFLVFRPVGGIPPDAPVGLRQRLAWLLERIGQAGVFILPVFAELNPDDERAVMGLILMGLALAVYYLGWGRYFFKGRDFRLLHVPLDDLPFPLAVSPVVYFVAAGLVMHSLSLIFAALIFAAGHIYNSYIALNQIQ